MQAEALGGSFRDPDGFVFNNEAGIFRQVNQSYKQEYQHLMDSGLYAACIRQQFLIPHTVTALAPIKEAGHLVIQPEQIPFISYPYEWSFSQLKDAALLTLQIQEEALKHGMTLKDASSYNIQFLRGKPIFIDTLSFAFYQEGKPWAPYKQFCEHFLIPLALMTHTETSLNKLLLTDLEGIPLSLGSKLLPLHTYLRFGLLLHVHLHAIAQKRAFSNLTDQYKGTNRVMPKNALLQLFRSLRSTIRSLTWKPSQTLWADYYSHTNYQIAAMSQKEQAVEFLLNNVKPATVWDLGSNTGKFSKIAAASGAEVIAMDFDIGATELHYLQNKEQNLQKILPLIMDITQPSPAIGWRNKERASLTDRSKPEMILALALIHHLAISRNIPLLEIASYLAELSSNIIIEFIPKSDSQVKRLLISREDIFPQYTQSEFEKAFSTKFSILEKIALQDSERTLYLMTRHHA
ncbi:hypothetical protein TH61_07575 [Rufibacter sp. DG15C]|uniref:SAM-dependent methyltransferase n=1 Tax=Rufibacter sp. DG15C TaxID=1379909 RepID=UPI00078DA1D3|nr:SAM-dependent methyltransferase [Rufibacter sp. DG15C]AMM51065.1 hypothetical protein TH61_07575 [Rufibacter sp. DG15C]